MNGTDDLIGRLSAQAGAEAGRSPGSFTRAFLFSSLLSLAIALVLSGAGFGLRDTLPKLFGYEPFLLKIAGALLLACGAFLLARRAALPGRGEASWLLLLPGILPFVWHAFVDPSASSARSGDDAVNCTIEIVLLSVPALLLCLRILKSAAPTRPTLAGALAGLLAGSIGTAAHALACYNDDGVQVAIWYGMGLATATALGALIGRKTLRW